MSCTLAQRFAQCAPSLRWEAYSRHCFPGHTPPIIQSHTCTKKCICKKLGIQTVSQNTKLVHSPATVTKQTNQPAVHSQREQSRLGAVQVNPKKKVFDGLVVRAVPAHIRPSKQRAFISLQAEDSHGFSGILTVNKEVKPACHTWSSKNIRT